MWSLIWIISLFVDIDIGVLVVDKNKFIFVGN